MNLEGKKVLVVGLGRTGEALCRFLLSRRARVTVSEKRGPEDLGNTVEFWTKRGVIVHTGSHQLSHFIESDLIVPSPGVPLLPELEKARTAGVPVISEVELAFRFLKGKIVGITGSNGKSTTATLVHKILKDSRQEAFLAGNIGTPLISFVEDSADHHVYVTELSSFQLEFIQHFSAFAAVFLNLTPDHLDWHKSWDGYTKAKKKLINRLKPEATAILNRDDPEVWKCAQETQARVLAFSRKHELEEGCFLKNGWIVLSHEDEKKVIEKTAILLPGEHNLENVMASVLAGFLFSVPPSQMRDSILDFPGLEHRLEKVLSLDGIDFYNDSKATNVEATLTALASFDRKIILILGGRDKGGDFTQLKKSIHEKVKRIILIGEARDLIRKALDAAAPLSDVESLKGAVAEGFAAAQRGDVVLLAPACTSFDMFSNFEERGRIFKKEVLALEKRVKNEKG
jgi:UDP-N-acetylmuramoylalanine--D-glutamate ligase